MTDSTIKIPLSKRGKYAGMFEAIVDAEDADLAKYGWSVRLSRNTQYAYRKKDNKKYEENIHLHRVIMSRMLQRSLEKHEQVDHINGAGTDCRRDNLRLASTSQNARNRGKQRNNKSGFKGVSWHSQNRKWRAEIAVNKQIIHLGLFDTPEEAHRAYCEAADSLHKEFKNYG